MKTRLDNDMINRTSVIYGENNTEFLWLGVVWDEN